MNRRPGGALSSPATVLASSLLLACSQSPNEPPADRGGTDAGAAHAPPAHRSIAGIAIPVIDAAARIPERDDSSVITDDAGIGTEGGVAPAEDASLAQDASEGGSIGGPVVTPAGPMPLISLGLPTYANYAISPASCADDGEYGTAWRTGHDPTPADPNSLSIDLTSVPAVARAKVYSVWFNEYGYNYDTSDGFSYALAGDFTIQANSAPGGGPPPESGWTVLAGTASNLLSSGANILDLSPYNWVRFNCTSSAQNVATQNTDTSLQWDLYDAHASNDGWKFGGDSITANAMGHQATGDSFDQLVHSQVANNPAFEMAGHGGWSADTMLSKIDAFLADFPGLYFALSLGTNDAPGNDPGGYAARMAQLVDKVLAAGKIPVLPTIPFTGEPAHATIPAYNEQIRSLYAAYGAQLVRGPDLYTVTFNGRATMFDNPTDLHPNAAGNAAIRQAWADAMVKNLYSH